MTHERAIGADGGGEAGGTRLPTLAVTLGDPGGIGPEVIAKALADPQVRSAARWRVLGPERALGEAATWAGIKPFWGRDDAPARDEQESEVLLVDSADEGDFESEPSAAGGEVSYRMVEEAIDIALCGGADGIVTGPISKEAWRMAGHIGFPGHTELLAARCGAPRCGMMFVTPRLRVILATAHVPLAAVAGLISESRVLSTIQLGHEACRDFGVGAPRVAVCGLNPHAGERGMLGREDAEVIASAVEAARDMGIDARGPFPGDTIFNAAVQGKYDLVVAMYHDQGLIPVKLLDRDCAVNVTVGLPIIRTSPDHGTAFDIAGQNQANPGSMKEAMMLAARMAKVRAQSPKRP